MTIILFSLSFAVILVCYAATALFILRRQKKKRQLTPPEDFVLLRSPGETLRRSVDTLHEQMMDWLLFGSTSCVMLLIAPLLLVQLFPSANAGILLISGVSLFIAGSVVVLGRMVQLGTRRANERQGYLGERRIAEHLEIVIASGYRLFHDIPMAFGDKMANIDHVAVGPQGAVVVETKTYSKPTNHKGSPLQVVFDGARICWPRYPEDTKTLWQVKKNAEWLQEYIRQQCNFTIPVAQVVAIPGWDVKEKVLIQPRVVRGSGAAHAVLQAIQADGPPVLSPGQVRDVAKALERLCRDVKD